MGQKLGHGGKQRLFGGFIGKQHARFLKRLEDKLDQGQIDQTIMVELKTRTQAIQFGGHCGEDMIIVIAPSCAMRFGATEVIHQEKHGFLERTKGTCAQESCILRVQIVPPETLHGPRRLANFPTPGRHRIGHDVHAGRIG